MSLAIRTNWIRRNSVVVGGCPAAARVIINGVGDRYDGLLAALAVAQVGGGAVEDGSGRAGSAT